MTARKHHKIAIDEDMTIYTAATQKIMLLDAVAKYQELELDLSQVAEIDTAGFQLLLLVKREAANAARTVSISAHSKAVRDLLDLYNAAGYFGDPLVITAEEHRKSA